MRVGQVLLCAFYRSLAHPLLITEAQGVFMTDLMNAGFIVLSFILAAAFVVACEHLK